MQRGSCVGLHASASSCPARVCRSDPGLSRLRSRAIAGGDLPGCELRKDASHNKSLCQVQGLRSVDEAVWDSVQARLDAIRASLARLYQLERSGVGKARKIGLFG